LRLANRRINELEVDLKQALSETKVVIQWVKVEDRSPKKSGMYVSKVKVIEDGLTYHPVDYNRFDVNTSTWSESRVGLQSGTVIEWLEEI
jgi:hypothetical protein